MQGSLDSRPGAELENFTFIKLPGRVTRPPAGRKTVGWPLLGVTCAVVRRDPRVSGSYGWPNTSDLYQVLSSSLRQVAPSTSRDRYEVRRSRFGPDGFTSGPFEAGAVSEDGAFHLRSSCVPRSASSSGYRCRDVCCAMFRACIVHAMQAELQHAQGTTQASGVARARRFSRCFRVIVRSRGDSGGGAAAAPRGGVVFPLEREPSPAVLQVAALEKAEEELLR